MSHRISSQYLFAMLLSLPIGLSGGAVKGIAKGSITQPQPISEVAAAVEKELGSGERMPRQQIAATAHNGIVTLSGTVDNLAVKRLAARIAKQVRGVRSVVNQLFVESKRLDDDTIAACVRPELHEDPVTEKSEIVVSVQHGEVAMTGAVSSLAEKQFAERAVASVAGVRDVDNQLTVDLKRHDKPGDLKATVDALIESSLRLQGNELSTKVNGTRVSVSGKVADPDQKDLLKHLLSVGGVTEVSVQAVTVDPILKNNRLRDQVYAAVNDDSVATAIGRAIHSSPILISYASGIDIEVKDGRVALSGKVDRLRAKHAATRIADNTIGVKDVTNDIAVQWSGGTPSDREIIEQTQAAIQRSAYLSTRDIRVHCHAAHVHLYGLVDSLFEKKRATWITDNVRGVVHVANMLAINPKSKTTKSDEELHRKIARGLKHALLAESVDVRVENGVAILSGEVETWRQWQEALGLVVEAGAQTPHNMIRVKGHPSHQGRALFVPERIKTKPAQRDEG